MIVSNLMPRLLRAIDPERAHRLTIHALRWGLVPRGRLPGSDPVLRSTVFGIDFPNPIGLAAGFDKSAEAFAPLLGLGGGFVEIGTLTPRPQAGNPKPRAFRLGEDQAAINRHGFNNDGLQAGLDRLKKRDRTAGILGINVGINKDSADPVGDYASAIGQAAPLADYLTINVSSPNTPGLRDLQAAEQLDQLMTACIAARDANVDLGESVPVLLKIAPDVSREMVSDIVEIAVARGAAGIIVGNTTISRPDGLRDRQRGETGGLSGRPLFPLSTRVLAWTYLATKGRLPLVGVGGIEDSETAYAKIRAGASLLQLYTALIYNGPELFGRIADGLAAKLRADGFSNLAEAVGADAANWADGPSDRPGT